MSKEKQSLSPAEMMKSFLKNNTDHYNSVSFEDYIVPSGSLLLDMVMNGGLKPGILRLTGVTEGGKTHCAFAFMRNFLKQKGAYGIYFKAEGRLSDEVKGRVGIKFIESDDAEGWEAGTCFVVKTNIYETIINTIRTFGKNNIDNKKYFFIIDSMDSVIPKNDAEKAIEDSEKVAGAALLSARFLRSMALSLSSYGHICVIISQVRSSVKINPYEKGDPKITNASGGNSLLHYSDWIFEFQKAFSSQDYIYDKDENKIGHYCKIILRKSCNESTGTEVRYPIRKGQTEGNSVWLEAEVRDILIQMDYVKKAGAWLKTPESFRKELKDNGFDFPEQFQGEVKLLEYLTENRPVLDFLVKKIRSLYV